MKHRPIPHSHYFMGGIILLCISIGMVALGAPVTLWDLETEGDTFTESLLEGFSIVPSTFTVTDPLRSTVQPTHQVLSRLKGS